MNCHQKIICEFVINHLIDYVFLDDYEHHQQLWQYNQIYSTILYT